MQRRSGHDGHYRELVRGWFRGKTLNQLAYERSWFRQGFGIGYAVYPGDRVFWKLMGVRAQAPDACLPLDPDPRLLHKRTHDSIQSRAGNPEQMPEGRTRENKGNLVRRSMA